MSLEILIAGIAHETNSYCRELTGADAFYTRRGDEVLRARQTSTDVAGMLAGCDGLGATPVPALVAGASPSGIIAAEVYDALKREILEGIRGAGAVDAIALALHGAGVVDGIDDLEGELAQASRSSRRES